MTTRSLILFALAILATSAIARPTMHRHSPELSLGEYQLTLSDESKGLAQLLDAPVPSGCLTLSSGHHFVLDTKFGERAIHRCGRYDLQDDEIILLADDSSHMHALNKDGEINIGGLRFVHHDISASMSGHWHVRGSDAKFEFTDDGYFKFHATGAHSAGKYTFDGSCLKLVWTSVDDDDVEADTVKKTITLDPDGTFWIDNYHYVRS
jgi:hypothetical protein